MFRNNRLITALTTNLSSADANQHPSKTPQV